jgi:hypothetical protein
MQLNNIGKLWLGILVGLKDVATTIVGIKKLGYLINDKMKSSMSLSKLYVHSLVCDIFSLVRYLSPSPTSNACGRHY